MARATAGWTAAAGLWQDRIAAAVLAVEAAVVLAGVGAPRAARPPLPRPLSRPTVRPGPDYLGPRFLMMMARLSVSGTLHSAG